MHEFGEGDDAQFRCAGCTAVISLDQYQRKVPRCDNCEADALLGTAWPDWTGYTDRFLRGMLRAGHAAGLVVGWQGPHLRERSYTVDTPDVGAQELPLVKVQQFVCEELVGKVAPRYTAWDPAP